MLMQCLIHAMLATKLKHMFAHFLPCKWDFVCEGPTTRQAQLQEIRLSFDQSESAGANLSNISPYYAPAALMAVLMAILMAVLMAA